jgi:hypothetical protein
MNGYPHNLEIDMVCDMEKRVFFRNGRSLDEMGHGFHSHVKLPKGKWCQNDPNIFQLTYML